MWYESIRGYTGKMAGSWRGCGHNADVAVAGIIDRCGGEGASGVHCPRDTSMAPGLRIYRSIFCGASESGIMHKHRAGERQQLPRRESSHGLFIQLEPRNHRIGVSTQRHLPIDHGWPWFSISSPIPAWRLHAALVGLLTVRGRVIDRRKRAGEHTMTGTTANSQLRISWRWDRISRGRRPLKFVAFRGPAFRPAHRFLDVRS